MQDNNQEKKLQEIREKKTVAMHKIDEGIQQVNNDITKLEQVPKVIETAGIIIDDIENQFMKATQLKKRDISFLLVAVAVQCIRQYVIGTLTQRESDQEAAKKVKKNEEHSDRKHKYYNPSLQEIITNPVPFDANIGSNGALSGYGRLGHRAATMGHDPLVGLVVGTANIATSTLTTWDLQSYHIKTGATKRDTIKEKAKTSVVLTTTKDKLMEEDMEGKIKVGTSLLKEIAHLRSDLFSTYSLPIPIVTAFSPTLASELSKYGLDMGNVVKVAEQASWAIFINSIISMIHRSCYDPTQDGSPKLYEVKTRKVLMYSNLIASASNVLAVALAQYIQVTNPATASQGKSALNYLDIGGMVVTLSRCITDTRFIHQVEEEFIKNQWYDYVHNTLD